MNRFDCMRLQIHERKFLIERFIEQKNKEHEEMEKEKRKASAKRR